MYKLTIITVVTQIPKRIEYNTLCYIIAKRKNPNFKKLAKGKNPPPPKKKRRTPQKHTYSMYMYDK